MANKLGRALYSEIHAETVQPPNVARYTFLNPSARDFFVEWNRAATDVVAVLRATVGRNPYLYPRTRGRDCPARAPPVSRPNANPSRDAPLVQLNPYG